MNSLHCLRTNIMATAASFSKPPPQPQLPCLFFSSFFLLLLLMLHNSFTNAHTRTSNKKFECLKLVALNRDLVDYPSRRRRRRCRCRCHTHSPSTSHTSHNSVSPSSNSFSRLFLMVPLLLDVF